MRLVLIEWLDAYGHDGDWEKPAGMTAEPRVIQTAGYYVLDSNGYAMVAASWDPAGDNACGVMAIPLSCIRTVVDLGPAPPMRSTDNDPWIRCPE